MPTEEVTHGWYLQRETVPGTTVLEEGQGSRVMGQAMSLLCDKVWWGI